MTDSERPRGFAVPPRHYGRWLLIFLAACVCITALDVLQLSVHYRMTDRSPWAAWQVFGWGLAEWIARGSICVAGAWLAAVWPIEDARRLPRAVLHLLAPVAIAPVTLALSVPFVMPQFRPPLSPLTATNAHYWKTLDFVASRYLLVTLVMYWLTVGIMHALFYHKRYVRQVRDAAELEKRSLQLEMSLGKARLEALKAQIHPHFIFNTLNAITVLAREGRRKAIVQTTTRLAKLLRAAVDEQSAVGTVSEELRLVRDYLFIERLRFGRRLQINWTIEDDALDAEVPRFSLQPLVENAIKHGVANTPGPATIEVGAVVRAARLVVWVRDSGAGLPHDGVNEGFGLMNVRNRLQHLYGDDQRLTMSLNPDGEGAYAELDVPLRRRAHVRVSAASFE